MNERKCAIIKWKKNIAVNVAHDLFDGIYDSLTLKKEGKTVKNVIISCIINL